MTRMLSELLGAQEPGFRQGLMKLEEAHGRPSTDIRLTAEILQQAKPKLHLLGLDSNDTTAEELYHALEQRLSADDARLEKTLRTLAATHVSAEGNVSDGIAHAVNHLPVAKGCYALKPTVLKKMLKKQQPKKVMKKLGYRSFDSMFKHESPAALLAAALLTESAAWQRGLHEQYKHLQPNDFEQREWTVVTPSTSRWQKLAAQAVSARRHNVVNLKELGAVVVLPLPAAKPSGATTASLSLALHALNDIQAASAFLKLVRVRGDFGKMVQLVACGEPELKTSVLDQTVPWHLVQRYYARARHFFSTELFEPYLQAEDFAWHSAEHLLAQVESSFEFWVDSAYLGWLHGQEGVSLNVLDVALNLCNGLPFANRISHHGQQALWHELMLRYLKHDTVEQAVAGELQPELVAEEALV